MNAAIEDPEATTHLAPVREANTEPLPRWRLVKNPFVRSEIKKPANGAVQCELALDLVKPVRNDLNDADLELAPVAQPARAVPPPLTTSPAESTGLLWSRLAMRLFGGKRT